MTYRRTGNLFTPTRNIWVPRIIAPPMCEISPALIGGIAAARRRTADVFSNVQFFWGMEGATWSNAEKGGSATGTVVASAARDANAKVGSYSMTVASNGSHVYFVATGNASLAEGKIGMWTYNSSFSANSGVLALVYNDDNRLFIVDYTGSTRIRWMFKAGGIGFDSQIGTGTARSVDTWYWLEVSWNISTPSFSLVCKNTEGGTMFSETRTDAVGSLAADADKLSIGDWVNVAGGKYIDSVMCSSSSAEDLWSLRNSAP